MKVLKYVMMKMKKFRTENEIWFDKKAHQLYKLYKAGLIGAIEYNQKFKEAKLVFNINAGLGGGIYRERKKVDNHD
jgi:hypothetical protein